MNREPVIVDQNGRPISAATYHYGADTWAPELRSWNPPAVSADAELLPERERLIARTHDMIRNHGLTSGAVQTHLDNIIGGGLRLSAKPDYRALGQDVDWAREWQRDTEREFRAWANDIDCYCDAARKSNFGGLIAQGYRSYLQSFEVLATMEWITNRPLAKYRTAVQMIDPQRLSNPHGTPDTERLRGGIELGFYGEPLAYHISTALDNDPFEWHQLRQWRRVPRETSWGRQMVIHIFDNDRPGQTRGKGGIVSVLAKMKMLEKFEQSTLQAAILNAMYAAVIESAMDWDAVGPAIGAKTSQNASKLNNDQMWAYMQQRAAWHQEGHVRYNGVKIPHLYPGENLKLLSPQHPSAAFASFEEATLRHIAGGLNLSYEQLSRDYSKTNYSSARAAMLETWRFFSGRRKQIAGKFATAVYACWLEEAIASGRVEVPPGAPSFYEAKTAWTQCEWIGPGRGHIDPLKEASATETELSNFMTTLEKECAERGLDWEEVLEQRAVELKRMQELAAQLGMDLNAFMAIGRKGGATARLPQQSDRQDDDERQTTPENEE